MKNEVAGMYALVRLVVWFILPGIKMLLLLKAIMKWHLHLISDIKCGICKGNEQVTHNNEVQFKFNALGIKFNALF